MTSIRLFEVAAAAMLLGACGSEPQTIATPPLVAAPTEVVAATTLPATRITTGSVRSATVSPLAANVMGNVTRVLVVEGQRVRAGELLVEIDDRAARAKTEQAAGGASAIDEAIAAAQANANVMAATYKRFAALRERGSVSPQEFDEVAAKHDAAQAQLAQALAQRRQARGVVAEARTVLSYASVWSPIDGVVTARMIDAGAQAAPGMPLLTVEDDAHDRVETTVDESIPVRAGDAVTIDGTIAARVTMIVPAVDPATRSALVKIDLPPHTALRSGAFVRVAFTVGSRSGITVPSSAIARTGQLTSVFVVGKDGIARMRLVTIGDAEGGRVEVLSGLDAGEVIVSRATAEIRDGVRVSVSPALSPRASARGLAGRRAPDRPRRAARPARPLAHVGVTLRVTRS